MAVEKEIILLRQLEEYDSKVPWTIYVEKMNFYFCVNNIKNKEMKKNILLSSVGTTTFTILRDIVVPKTLKEIRYEDLLMKLWKDLNFRNVLESQGKA